MDFFDNSFLTYAVALTQGICQPGYLSLFAMSFLASTLLPVGSEWLLVLMLTKGYAPATAIMIATAGNALGAITTYLVGVYGGTWLIERLFRISAEQQERAERFYRRYGAASLLFSWLPVIGDPLCLVGGVMRINFALFCGLVVTGKLVRYVATAWLTLTAIH